MSGVIYTHDGWVVTITLDRNDQLNSIDAEMTNAL
jgi:enoyl-CoA hydratase/carnithine racemase